MVDKKNLIFCHYNVPWTIMVVYFVFVQFVCLLTIGFSYFVTKNNYGTWYFVMIPGTIMVVYCVIFFIQVYTLLSKLFIDLVIWKIGA